MERKVLRESREWTAEPQHWIFTNRMHSPQGSSAVQVCTWAVASVPEMEEFRIHSRWSPFNKNDCFFSHLKAAGMAGACTELWPHRPTFHTESTSRLPVEFGIPVTNQGACSVGAGGRGPCLQGAWAYSSGLIHSKAVPSASMRKDPRRWRAAEHMDDKLGKVSADCGWSAVMWERQTSWVSSLTQVEKHFFLFIRVQQLLSIVLISSKCHGTKRASSQ